MRRVEISKQKNFSAMYNKDFISLRCNNRNYTQISNNHNREPTFHQKGNRKIHPNQQNKYLFSFLMTNRFQPYSKALEKKYFVEEKYKKTFYNYILKNRYSINMKNQLKDYFLVSNDFLKHKMFNRYLLPLVENLHDYNSTHFNPILEIFFKYSPYILLTGCIYFFRYIVSKLKYNIENIYADTNGSTIEKIYNDEKITDVIPSCKYFIALYLTACNLSMKFWDEQFFISPFENAGLSKENMATMEIEVLKYLKYDLEIGYSDIFYFFK